jgi:hypothetical protein
LLGYWKKNNTHKKKGWARNNGEEGEGVRNAKVIIERKKEMIFYTFCDWSCAVMICSRVDYDQATVEKRIYGGYFDVAVCYL